MNTYSNMENLSPHTLREVMRELQQIDANPLEGVKVLINETNITDVQALIEGPAGTPYVSGVFRVKLTLNKDFPSTPPKAHFLTKIFHPNVAANGEICVSTLKRDWKPDLGIKHILLTIKCLLIVPNPESALNEEAGKLLLERYDDYFQRAKMITEIHAQQYPKLTSSATATSTATANDASNADDEGPQSKKHAAAAQDKKVLDKKKEKLIKEKKRMLKRL